MHSSESGCWCVDNVNASLLVSNLSFLAIAGVIIDSQRNTRFQLGTRDAVSQRRTPCGLPSALAQARNSELVVLMTRITSHDGTAGCCSHSATLSVRIEGLWLPRPWDWATLAIHLLGRWERRVTFTLLLVERGKSESLLGKRPLLQFRYFYETRSVGHTKLLDVNIWWRERRSLIRFQFV